MQVKRFQDPATIEAVAKAMFDNCGQLLLDAGETSEEIWENAIPESRKHFVSQAQAAITALLEHLIPYEEAAQIVEKWASWYPERIFPADSDIPDSIAATALRVQLPKIAKEIRYLGLISDERAET